MTIKDLSKHEEVMVTLRDLFDADRFTSMMNSGVAETVNLALKERQVTIKEIEKKLK